ncbi:hypothetical protein THRCLA_03282 [Thraustotheca clavata]|uniref:Strawberry notch n=1 Tax=Thraustotheca clavata TaxID=74557 RepID=A0A1W0A2L1_9STRA|nr:hypothetical protein THRCLA_03282 [Thraustotheca clavata]
MEKLPLVEKMAVEERESAAQEESKSKDNEGVVHQEDSVFTPYECKSLTIGQPHPGNISESALLSTAPLPKCTYNHDAFPEDLIARGKLTNLQLEGILYACMQHQRILPSGERCGFFLGDGTGVGKGRQLAGIIFDNACRGRKKHLWLSVSDDLRADAERDLNDIGCHISVIDGCQQLDKANMKGLGKSNSVKQGVLYSTYSTLTSNLNHATKSRLTQIVEWCGPNFDGCILFDECHKAKHGELSSKDANASKVAQAVAKLQQLLPLARVVYCSATGVGGIEHMAYMSRLGLWGPSTAFAGFSDFLFTIRNKGMGAMEMLAIELKMQGKYVSRGLSYQGADFHVETVHLDSNEEQLYQNTVDFWNLLQSFFLRACTITRSSGDVMKTFWGCHQRFFRQLCMALKVPFIIKSVKQCLEDGHCAVIGLQTTGEATMERNSQTSSSELVALKGLISISECMLIDFVSAHFPTKINMNTGTMNATYDINLAETASQTIAPEQMQTACDGTVHSIICQEMKSLLLQKIRELKLPPNPLDHLIDELGGTENVAELTGRRIHVVKGKSGLYEIKPRSDHLEKLNIEERQNFVDGRKLVAIISDAASTGISLHADRRCINQRRRIHITLELAWSADKAIQQLGRSHRSNQSCAPSYILVTTNCGGENRFVASVAKKMLTMGALTKGDRRAGSGQDFSSYNFETKYGFQALREVFRCICNDIAMEGLDSASLITQFPFLLSQTHMHVMFIQDLRCIGLYPPPTQCSVKIFLNRILGLPPQHQNALFTYFEKALQAVIQKATQEGKYDEGYDDIKGRKGQLKNSTQLSQTVQHSHIEVDRGISFEEALSIQASVAKDYKAEFYISDMKYFGEYLYMLMLTNPRSYSIVRPNTGYMYFDRSKIADMRDKYTKISAEKAEKGWRRIFDSSKERCVHWTGCKTGATCRVGMRMMQYQILTGSVLPIWKLLETLIAMTPNISSTQLRIVRIALTNHPTLTKIVGLNFPSELIIQLHLALHNLNANRVLSQEDAISPVDIAARERIMRPTKTILNYFASTSMTPEKGESALNVASRPKETRPKTPSRPTTQIPPSKRFKVQKATNISVAQFFTPVATKTTPQPIDCIDLVSDDDVEML